MNNRDREPFFYYSQYSFYLLTAPLNQVKQINSLCQTSEINGTILPTWLRLLRLIAL